MGRGTVGQVNGATFLPGVHLRSRPAEQAVSWLFPSKHRVVLGHGLSVVDIFILVLQSSNAKRLQAKGERSPLAHKAMPLYLERECRSQENYLSRHSSSPFVSLRPSKQLTPGVRLRVEQVDVLTGPSALQCQARVQAAVAQTLNSHLWVEVNWSDVFRGKGHVLRSKLIIIVILVGVEVKVTTSQ